jgi:hypothetical protein
VYTCSIVYILVYHLFYKMVTDFCFLNILVSMAHCKTTTCKQVTKVRSSRHPDIDWMLERSSKSHNDGKTVGYFSRELRSLLHTPDYHAEPLYINKKTPLCSKGYKWEV